MRFSNFRRWLARLIGTVALCKLFWGIMKLDVHTVITDYVLGTYTNIFHPIGDAANWCFQHVFLWLFNEKPPMIDNDALVIYAILGSAVARTIYNRNSLATVQFHPLSLIYFPICILFWPVLSVYYICISQDVQFENLKKEIYTVIGMFILFVLLNAGLTMDI